MTLLFRNRAQLLFWAVAFAIVWIGSQEWAPTTSSIVLAGLLGTGGLAILYFTRASRLVPVRVTSTSPISPPDAADLERFDFERG